MEKSRRSFLQFLGLGAVAAVPTGMVVRVAPAIPGSEFSAYRFQCDCGGEVVAQVPAEVQTVVCIDCGCGRTYRMRWLGDSWNLIQGVRDGPNVTSVILPSEQKRTRSVQEEMLARSAADKEGRRKNGAFSG